MTDNEKIDKILDYANRLENKLEKQLEKILPSDDNVANYLSGQIAGIFAVRSFIEVNFKEDIENDIGKIR